MIILKIKLRLKWLIGDIKEFLKFPLAKYKRKGEVQILCFHGVCRDDQQYINGRFIKETQLKELLKALKTNFNILSLEDYLNNNLDTEKLNILLTFDDGYKNNQTLLLPVLKELNLPIVLFVLSRGNKPLWSDLFDVLESEKFDFSILRNKYKIIDNSNQGFKNWMSQQGVLVVEEVTTILLDIAKPLLSKYKEFWELMTKEELININDSPLVTLANHTENHYSLIRLSDKEIKNEVEHCALYLENIGAKNTRVIAFPYGHYNDSVCNYLQSLGYRYLFSASGNLRRKDNTIDRLVINPFISKRNQLQAILDGKY